MNEFVSNKCLNNFAQQEVGDIEAKFSNKDFKRAIYSGECTGVVWMRCKVNGGVKR